MKRSMFRLLMTCFSIIVIGSFASSTMAQGNGKGNGGGNGGGGGGGEEDPPPAVDVGYRIHWVFGPEETTGGIMASDNALKMDGDGAPTKAYVVGYYNRADRENPSAYVYVMENPANPNDTANQFLDIEDLVGSSHQIPWATTETPLSSFTSHFRQVNENGLISGYVKDPQGTRRGVYLDLSEATPELRLIPEPPNPYDRYEGEDVSSTGDILVHYRTLIDSMVEAYVFRPSTGEILMIEDASTNQPIQFTSGRFGIHMNSTGQIVGHREVDDMAIRHFLDTGETFELPGLQLNNGDDLVNDFGQVTATGLFSTNSNGKKPPREEPRAVRIGFDDALEWTSSVRAQTTWTINNLGDVVYFDSSGSVHYYNETVQLELFVGDLVIPESDPLGWFTGNESYQMRLTEADQTGFGWLTPAKSSSNGIAILIPEILP